MEYSDLIEELGYHSRGGGTLNPVQRSACAGTVIAELVALAREVGVELSNEELEAVSGGAWNGCNHCKNDCGVPFWR